VSRFVIDASVVLSWCFPDEDSALARHVADMFKRGDTAIAPSFWPHEVLNALLVGEKRKRISKDLTRSFLEDLSSLPIGLQQVPSAAVFDRLHRLSYEHGITSYDAAYLDLVLDSEAPLATLDEDLIRACNKTHALLVAP
jgi:predicted nucleic acid-binding protein